ncbi:Copper amine oxidase, partial [Theobroma cacao]
TTLLCLFYLLYITSSNPHPLDSLTTAGLLHVLAIVNQSCPSSKYKLTFQYVRLEEPDKPVMHSWLSKPTSPSFFHCFAQQSHKIVVDFLQGSGYPFLTNEEQAAAVGLAVKHELFLASLKKREALMPPKLFAPLKPLGGLGKRRPKES